VLDSADHCSLRYLSFSGIRDTYATVEQAGPLRDVF
jgi:hypothetical protein